MNTKKIVSLGLALALALAATPALAAGQVVTDEWNQTVDQSGAKGSAYYGPAALKGTQGPGGGDDFAGNFGKNEGWVNKNAQGPGGGDSADNFNKETDWK